MSLLTEQQKKSSTTSEVKDEGLANVRLSSPDAKQLKNAELHVKEKQFSDLQDKVINFVRRNSLLKEA